MTAHEDLIAALPTALQSQDPESIGALLADHVIWDDCIGRDAVLEEVAAARSAGLAFEHAEITELEDRVVVDLILGEEMGALHLAAFIEDAKIVEIRAFGLDTHDEAVAVARAVEPERPKKRAKLDSLAAIFPVRDAAAAMELYRRLGFDVHSYDDGNYYAFAERDKVHVHLARVDDIDPLTNMSAAYLYVDDARSLYAEWRHAGVSGRLREPEKTDYGMLEGAYIDPDGNLLRFGSGL